MPQLVRDGTQTRLLVNGAPYYVLGGELGNSSASYEGYMVDVWPKLASMNINTLLVPVYWELIEPEEGRFDFESVEWLIRRARREQLKLVLLWFGSWKNSMSCYAPSWVKRDSARFPRARDRDGIAQEILSPFSANNLEADRQAFAALMDFIREIDEKHRTVIMVQVENEIGMLPDARDHHPVATQAFQGPVPPDLMKYLQSHRDSLVPEIAERWERYGSKTTGTWEKLFGKGIATEEMFIAWHLARYANAVALAGKERYPLPMFVNAALNRPNVPPGKYPSGGPLPHLLDIWKAATPDIDLVSPDFYNPRFKHWNDLYTQQGDALFIPEIRFDETVGAKALFAFGHYDCIGFSPFSIESAGPPEQASLTRSYDLMQQLMPLLESQQGQLQTEGVWLTREAPEMKFTLGNYRFTGRHDLTLGWSPQAKEDDWPHGGAIVIRVDDETFFVAGTGVVFTFAPKRDGSGRAGIDQLHEGVFVNGRWHPERSMNGDQSHQGRHLRIPTGDWEIQKLRLYTYE